MPADYVLPEFKSQVTRRETKFSCKSFIAPYRSAIMVFMSYYACACEHRLLPVNYLWRNHGISHTQTRKVPRTCAAMVHWQEFMPTWVTLKWIKFHVNKFYAFRSSAIPYIPQIARGRKVSGCFTFFFRFVCTLCKHITEHFIYFHKNDLRCTDYLLFVFIY